MLHSVGCEIVSKARISSDESMMLTKDGVVPRVSRNRKITVSSGFVTFFKIESVILRQIYPGMSESAIALGERWENMTDAEKGPYVEMASADDRRREPEVMDSCRKASEDVVVEKEVPSTTRTAFLIFSSLEGEKLLESHRGMSGLEIAVTQKWASISDEEKKLYEWMAQMDGSF
ncbi:uncharacterized protein [Aristolochia californica]|uniref:uncharacterized protein n=1 Tax=Aristolochia californica TaxID=171875 RepID=UPI0035DFCE1D